MEGHEHPYGPLHSRSEPHSSHFFIVDQGRLDYRRLLKENLYAKHAGFYSCEELAGG
jgi:hypothetical protein